MFVVTLSVVLILAYSASSEAASVQPKVIQPRDCTAPGPKCESCSAVVMCESNATVPNGYNKVPLGSCDTANNETCNYNKGVCSNEPNPICLEQYKNTIKCAGQGVFPDPVDCQRYHMCTSTELEADSIGVDCSNGFAFNLRTATCDKKLFNNKCPIAPPVPVCKFVGQSGVLRENQSYYYYCKTESGSSSLLIPSMRKCANGKIYYPTLFTCR